MSILSHNPYLLTILPHLCYLMSILAHSPYLVSILKHSPYLVSKLPNSHYLVSILQHWSYFLQLNTVLTSCHQHYVCLTQYQCYHLIPSIPHAITDTEVLPHGNTTTQSLSRVSTTSLGPYLMSILPLPSSSSFWNSSSTSTSVRSIPAPCYGNINWI